MKAADGTDEAIYHCKSARWAFGNPLRRRDPQASPWQGLAARVTLLVGPGTSWLASDRQQTNRMSAFAAREAATREWLMAVQVHARPKECRLAQRIL